MGPGERPGEIAIGAALAEARARAGLELADAEQRTKIRRRYLGALEQERWAELPSPAYAKGFLRTYAEFLGLDAELLVDEYRRQVEAKAAAEGTQPGDRVLTTPRRLADGERGRGPWVLAGVALAAAIAGVGVLTAGDGEDGEPARPPAKGETKERRSDAGAPGELVRLELRVRKPVEVCLLGAGREELIDGQLLVAGTRDAFASERFQLRFPAGFDRDQVALELDGKRAKLPRTDGPARLEITPPGRVREASPPGESCP